MGLEPVHTQRPFSRSKPTLLSVLSIRPLNPVQIGITNLLRYSFFINIAISWILNDNINEDTGLECIVIYFIVNINNYKLNKLYILTIFF